MRSVLVVVTLALSAPALAGCVSLDELQSSGLPASVDLTKILPYLDLSDAHDHADVHAHRAAWNTEALGWTPYGNAMEPGRYNQVQVFGDLAFVSVYAQAETLEPGLVVVDVSDPAAPTVVGTYATKWVVPIDVHLSEDGKFAALAGHRLETGVTPPASTGCTAVPLPDRPFTICQPYAPAGVELLDVSDPASPKLAARWQAVPAGGHTVKLHTIDGDVHAFIASYGVHYADRLASHVEIVRHDPGAPTGFAPVSRFFASESSGGKSDGARVFVHDMYVQEHPVTGERLLYVAYWDGGVVIANVDDPAEPREIAAWKDFDRAEFGNIHYVEPLPVALDGKHYTIAAPEYGSAEHAGETYVLDTTDPAAPRLIGKWHLPGNPVNPGGYMHSPHNTHLTPEGLMVMGHYHAGVWVLDLRPVFAGETEEPAVVGYAFPAPPEGEHAHVAEGENAPSVWNAVWTESGAIVASDIVTGLYVFRVSDLEAPGAPPYQGRV